MNCNYHKENDFENCGMYEVTDNRCCFHCEHKEYCKGYCLVLEEGNRETECEFFTE